MMNMSIKVFIAVFIVSIFSMPPSYAGICADYNAVENTPYFNTPSKKSFKKFLNRFISKGTPFHMAHDVIAAQGDSFTVIGKFDYGSIAHKDLKGERVDVYYTGTGLNDWVHKGKFTTDWDGKVYAEFSSLPVGNYRVRMVVRGDLSSTDAWVSVVTPGAPAVVFDIDNTLTDGSFSVGDYLGLVSVAPISGAVDLVNAYRDLGYQIVYVTARTYWYAKGTREWLAKNNMPVWTLKTTFDTSTSLNDRANYKRDYLIDIQASGIDIYRAYGDETTDIEGFSAAGVPLSDIWIIGEKAGDGGTQPIVENHYYQHIADVVDVSPSSSCM